MKTINFFKSALLAAILLIGGNAWGQEVYASVDFTTKSVSHANYTDTWDYAGWSIYGAANNNAGWAYVRVGGKSTASVKTSSFTSPIINAEISSITLTAINTASGSSFTMDNITLKVASDANFTTIVDEVSNVAVATAMTFVPTSGTSWAANSYYKLEFNWSSTTTSNRGMDVEKVELFAATTSSVATPEFSPSSGTYTEAQNVEITCATEGATIYYTTNGDDPTATSTEYSGAIPVSTTTTLKAIAIKGGESSNIASATYTILTIQQATIEDFLAASESEDVYYELTGRMSNITNTTYGNFDLTDATGTVYVYGLTATMQISNDKSFASLGLAEGDVITIRGTRASYSGTAQVGGPAYFVSKTILPVLTTPVANEATTITANSFVANWDAVDNATSYELNVWTEESVEFGIVNPSFENGLENWVAEDAYSLSTDNAHTGTQSLYFSASKTKDLRQTINNVTPGETITVSYWYYLDPTMTGNGPRLWCTWEGSDDQSLQVQDYSNVKGAWTEATISTTVPAGATALNLEIRVYNNSNGYLDDITVTQTNTSTIQVQTPITGSPFAVTETSKAITGLTAETTYHYSVVAKAESYTDSEASNIIDVTTSKGSGTGLCHPATLEGVSFDGQVIRNAAGLELSVYTVSGVCVKTAAGDIDMSAMPHGIYLVRSANAVLKITK